MAGQSASDEKYHPPRTVPAPAAGYDRATLLAQSKLITLDELSELRNQTIQPTGMPLRNEEAEKQHIIEALKQTGYNKSRAAQLLGIDRKTLYNKLKLYGIEL